MLCNLPIFITISNSGHPLLQLIPYLEFDDRGDPTAASVTAELWGKFLIALFECWVRADISRISIELFDATLQKWCGSENPQPRRDCQACDWHRLCPHARQETPDSVLCAGYQAFNLTPHRICG